MRFCYCKISFFCYNHPMKTLTLSSTDNYTLHLNIYECSNPKAVIKIIHGMTERKERFNDFAEFLSKNGYIVVTADLRGHGQFAPILSHIADKDGAKLLIEDETVIRQWIVSEYPNLPMMLFAHSMGSIIARKILQNNSRLYNKVILSGYVNPQPAGSFGVLLTKIFGKFRTMRGHSALLTALAIGPFAAALPNAQPHDLRWLSYNEENIARFKADQFCGKEFTIGSYNALFQLVADIAKPKSYQNINADLPILLIAGEDDPCTGFAKGRAKSLSVLQKAGFTNIEVETIPNMRHEILNETEHEKVYNTVLQFIKK